MDLQNGDEPLRPLESARVESLLAYLLIHRDAPQPRQRLAFVLWPDSNESQALTNLRHVLHNLRRALPDSERFLDVTARTLQWRADAPFWLDLASFEESLSRTERDADQEERVRALRAAVEAYGGDLLEGRYDDWLLAERERLRRRFEEALERLVQIFADRGQHADAIALAERLLHHDPLKEETYRLLMQLHDARGDRARALRVYHACTAMLERELGLEPSAATRGAYEALLPAAKDSDPPVDARPAGPPLVGRAREWTTLTTLWGETERGCAQLVLVTGEPGIGKTRLLEGLASWCSARGARIAETRAYPGEGALAYGPVVEWLRSDALRTHMRRLSPLQRAELSRVLPELLAGEPSLDPPEPLPEDEQRHRLFDAAARVILAAQPVLLLADDLHWCDRETLRLLHYVLRIDPEACLLVGATARREEVDDRHPLNDLVAGLRNLNRLTEIDLKRLGREETEDLAAHLAGRRLGRAEAERLYRETEGNPLFVVEALRAGWSGAEGALDWVTPRVQAVIEARLAQLSETARNLLEIAATTGHEFTAELLAEAGDASDEVVVRGLDELWRRRLVRERGADAYDFTHDKIREVTYQGLSPSRRRRHHRRVAQALERLHMGEPSSVSGQIAAHYERAGALDAAARWYLRAAEAAQHLHANVESVRLLERGLAVLRGLPEGSERAERELQILVALPGPLVSLEGVASPRVREVQERALKVTRTLGIEPSPPLLRSLALTHLACDEFEFAREAGRRLLAFGEREPDDGARAEGEYVLGISAFWSGQFRAASKHLRRAVRYFSPDQRSVHLLRYGQDVEVVCRSRLAVVLWFLGRPADAVRARAAALARADEIDHPYSRAVARVFGAMLAFEMGDVTALRTFVDEQSGLDPTRYPSHIERGARCFAGYVDVLDGRPDVGVQRIQSVLEELLAEPQGAPGMRAWMLRLLAEACALSDRAAAGLDAVSEMLTGAVRVWEAEAHRLRARFLAALNGTDDEVARELERAVEVARRQGAPVLETRALQDLLAYRLARADGLGVGRVRSLLAGVAGGVEDPGDGPEAHETVATLPGN